MLQIILRMSLTSLMQIFSVEIPRDVTSRVTGVSLNKEKSTCEIQIIAQAAIVSFNSAS